MPARSNDFQRLVAVIKHNLADGAVVTESKMLNDLVTGDPVEVDVCVEGNLGGERILVCIECRDHGRKADVNWVHQQKARHDRLPTNALILAHRKGFSQSALKVAKQYGIKTVTLEEVEDVSFPEVLGREMSLWAKTFAARVERVWFVVEATDGLPEERVRAMPNQSIFDEHGTLLGFAVPLIDYALNSAAATAWFLEHGMPDHTWFQLTWSIGNASGEPPLFLEKLEPRCFRRIIEVQIAGPCSYTVNGLKLRRARFGSTHLAWGKTRLFGRDAMLVATRDEMGLEKISVNLAGDALSTAMPAEADSAADAVTSYR
jgi:hypothetical protein